MSYIYKTGRAELQDQIKRHASVIKGRVLDIGAGNYARYKNLFTYDDYVRMDIAPGKDVDLIGKIEAIPAQDNSFDSIICTQVLGDVFDLAKAFDEIKRVLKPNGKAFITESLFDPLHDEPHDYWRFTAHSLRTLTENAGLEVEVLEARGGYHSVMAQQKARYIIEKYDASKKSYARLLSFVLKVCGAYARFRDKHDTSRAAKLFTHGYLLIARKHD